MPIADMALLTSLLFQACTLISAYFAYSHERVCRSLMIFASGEGAIRQLRMMASKKMDAANASTGAAR